MDIVAKLMTLAAVAWLGALPAVANEAGVKWTPLEWSTLAGVRTKFDGARLTPVFTAEQQAIDGESVVIRGFMVPLRRGHRHTRFLLSPKSPKCKSCTPDALDGVVEVSTLKPMAVSGREIAVRDELAVSKRNEGDVYYRLKNASLAR